jgi:hypothetical protein
MALVMSNGLACLDMMHPDFDTDQESSFPKTPYNVGKFKQTRQYSMFLNQMFKNLARFSFKKEWHWVSLQLQQIMKR